MAGFSGQNTYAIAIGSEAGLYYQGMYSIAIGNKAGSTNQSQNSIVLNADSDTLDASTSGFFVQPIRKPDETITEILAYNTSRNEIIRTDTVPNATRLYMNDLTNSVHNGVYPISLFAGSGDGNKLYYGSNKLYFNPGTSELTINGILKAGDAQGNSYGLKINDWQIHESDNENLVFSYNSSTKLYINDSGETNFFGDISVTGNVKTASSLHINSTAISTHNDEFRVSDGVAFYRGMSFQPLLKKYFLSLPSVVIRKTALCQENEWFDQRFNLIEELDLFIRITYSWKLDMCRDVLAKYRVHKSSYSWTHKDLLYK